MRLQTGSVQLLKEQKTLLLQSGIMTATRCSPIFRLIRWVVVYLLPAVKGIKYNKGHYLEYLQADSGYMKTWPNREPIGLFLLLTFYFIVMRYGFHHFLGLRIPEIRTYYIGLLVMMFTLLVAQYSQMAISQYPVVLYFYATMVIFIKLADFDKLVQPLKQRKSDICDIFYSFFIFFPDLQAQTVKNRFIVQIRCA